MKVFKQVTVNVRLEASEQFSYAETRNGFRFTVETLRIHPGDFRCSPFTVLGRGPGIKTDGSRALINREEYLPMSKLPWHVLEGVIAVLNGTIPEVTQTDWVQATKDHPARSGNL